MQNTADKNARGAAKRSHIQSALSVIISFIVICHRSFPVSETIVQTNEDRGVV